MPPAATAHARSPSRAARPLERLRGLVPRGASLSEASFRSRHRALQAVLAAHAPLLLAFGLATGHTFAHALADATLIAAFAGAAYAVGDDRRWGPVATSFGLLTAAAAVVDLSHGRTEAHFHYFVLVSALALYEQWAPYVLAIVYVLVQHGVMGAMDADAVTDHASHAWAWAGVHTAYIGALALTNLATWRASEQVREAERAARDELDHERAFLAAVLDAQPGPLLACDQFGRVVFANRDSRVRIGGDDRVLDISAWSDRLPMVDDHGRRVPRDQLAAFRALRGEEVRDAEYGVTGVDGEPVWLAVNASPIRSSREDRQLGVVMTTRDVTARRELQRAHAALQSDAAELARSNEELEQFAYVTSHDLGDPLRMVSSYLELLERRCGDQLDERGRSFMRHAAQGARRMQTLIDDLLEYSRTGRAALRDEPVPLGPLAAEVLAGLELRVADSGGRVEVVEPLPTVRGDPTLLGQLVQNLVANALKFHRAGVPPRVTVSGEDLGDGGWELRVDDEGIGIDAAQAERVLQMFARLNGPGEFEGTGIGLAVAQRVAERHGGRVHVEPNPGADHGTRMRVRVEPGA